MLRRSLLCPAVVASLVCVIAFELLWQGQPAASEETPSRPSAAKGEQLAPISATADRSPIDVVLLPGGDLAVSINYTSHSASLVSLREKKVLHELPVGKHPAGIAIAPSGEQILVSSVYGGDLRILRVVDRELVEVGRVDLGGEPHGIAVAADNRSAYVGLAGLNQVAVVDLEKRSVTSRIPVGAWPRYLALSPDGKKLAVGAAGISTVQIVDVETQKIVLTHEKMFAINQGQMLASKDGKYVWLPWMVYRDTPISKDNIRRGWVLGSRIGRVQFAGNDRREAVTLDTQGKAVADVHGLAMNADESLLAVTSPGTHELLLLRNTDLPINNIGDRDHIPNELLKDTERFTRVALGGRPMGVKITADGKFAVVANYFQNSLQLVDLGTRKLAGEIPLGGVSPESAQEISLARRGEMIFHDAERSFDQWYSCHSCHQQAGTNAESMDTFNDGSANTKKTVLSLYNIHKTGPWTWHGWQVNLEASVKKSMIDTMLGPPVKDDEVKAVVAYLQTLQLPPNPYRQADGSLTPAAERGKKVFASAKANCITCHSGDYFTDGEIHDVGLEEPADRYRGFNTPSLIGVYRKTRLLHHGKALSLEEVLTGLHSPEKVTKEGPLTEAELRDLVEYLKSL